MDILTAATAYYTDLDNNDSSVRQRLKSYEETCETVGRHLAMDEEQQKQQHFAQSCYTVVYIVNPGPHMSSYLDMCRCFHKLKEAYARIAHKNFIDQQPRIALQLMPIDHLLRPSAFGGYTMLGMKDIAFSVYSKCFARVTRKVSMSIFFIKLMARGAHTRAYILRLQGQIKRLGQISTRLLSC